MHKLMQLLIMLSEDGEGAEAESLAQELAADVSEAILTRNREDLSRLGNEMVTVHNTFIQLNLLSPRYSLAFMMGLCSALIKTVHMALVFIEQPIGQEYPA